MRFHLFPFRTEKLSSLTPMVLRLSRGRVGSRLFKVRSYGLTFFCIILVGFIVWRFFKPISDVAKEYKSDLNSFGQMQYYFMAQSLLLELSPLNCHIFSQNTRKHSQMFLPAIGLPDSHFYVTSSAML